MADIVFGKLLSGGQTCIAPDYALVHQSEIDTFIESYDRLVKAAYPDGPTSKDYTSIVNDPQHAIRTEVIDDARAHGARIIEVGHRPGEASRRPHTDRRARRYRRQRIAHEEIFGPIMPIFPYRDIDDAIGYMYARPRPLALHYFGDNDADRRRVLDRTTSRNVTINGTILHVGQDDLPFGGVGASGMGKYHGIEGFRTLSHPKGIFVQGRDGTAHASCGPLRQACRCSPQLLPSMTWRAAAVDGDACRPSAFAWQRPIGPRSPAIQNVSPSQEVGLLIGPI